MNAPPFRGTSKSAQKRARKRAMAGGKRTPRTGQRAIPSKKRRQNRRENFGGYAAGGRITPSDMGKMEKFVKIPRTARPNQYLQTLVYPEKYSGVRYPDTFSRSTAMVKLIIQQNLFYFPVGTVAEPVGSFYFIFRPTLVHPLWVYGPFAVAALPQWVLNFQSDRFGLYGLTLGTLDPSEQDNQMLMNNGVTYNVRAPLTFSTVDSVQDPYQVVDSAGQAYYGYTFAVGTGTSTVTTSVTVNGQSAIGDTLLITFTNGSTTVSQTITSVAVNQTVWTGTSGSILGLLVNDGATNGFGLCCGRQAPVGFRFKFTLASSNLLSVVSIQMAANASAGPAVQLGLAPYDWPDLTAFLTKWTVYRPVSASIWCAYEGSTLNDGGQIAGVMYGGGEHPNVAGLYNYSQLAQEPEGYENKLDTGMYQFYKPASTKDTEMRKPINSEEWTHPYMVGAGLVDTPTQVNALRLRLVMNAEFVSPSQLWEYYPTTPNPRSIEDATRILHGARTSMSNDGHLSAIYNWIKNAASEIGGFVANNAHWMVPVASAAAALL